MANSRITIRIPADLGTRLRNRSRIAGATESELVREALENYLGQTGTERSAFDVAQELGLVGCAKGAPKDLSTHRRHFEGFGKSR